MYSSLDAFQDSVVLAFVSRNSNNNHIIKNRLKGSCRLQIIYILCHVRIVPSVKHT
jgi:hypothetical protein